VEDFLFNASLKRRKRDGELPRKRGVQMLHRVGYNCLEEASGIRSNRAERLEMIVELGTKEPDMREVRGFRRS